MICSITIVIKASLNFNIFVLCRIENETILERKKVNGKITETEPESSLNENANCLLEDVQFGKKQWVKTKTEKNSLKR